MTEEEYKEQYNNGYIIAQFMPELSEVFIKATGEDEKLQALKDGIEKYGIDDFENKLPAWMKDNPFSKDKHINPNKDIDKGLDIDIKP